MFIIITIVSTLHYRTNFIIITIMTIIIIAIFTISLTL